MYRITTIYSDDSGLSQFGEMEIPLADSGEIGMLSQCLSATGIIFRETAGDYDFSWHNTPRKQFVIILEGEVDFTVSTGETRRYGPGDVVLLEDTEGKGHCSKAVDGQPRRSIFVAVE